MVEPRLVVCENALVWASAAACAAVDVGDAVALSRLAKDWLQRDSVRRAIASGECSVDFEAGDVALRLWLQPSPVAATQLVVLVEPLATGLPSERQREIDHAYARLRDAEEQLLQSDKMASIGQLAAGVAHEINNPIGYIYSNLGTLGEYVNNMFRVIGAYEKTLRGMPSDGQERRSELAEVKQQVDYDFLIKDLPSLLAESREGIERVRKIVQDLRDFSRAGYEEEWTLADLHRGLDSTLNIVWNDLKYKCEILRNYGDIPRVECLPSQLNQVFLNILVNAGHAIEQHGTIRISTGQEDDKVFIEIADSGKGIAPENLSRVFDPFFTTKPVGQGTGLGLSLSYSIVRKHHGHISVESSIGAGTTFRIMLPMQQHSGGAAAPDAPTPTAAPQRRIA
jgi:signal transduction histidine kinase